MRSIVLIFFFLSPTCDFNVFIWYKIDEYSVRYNPIPLKQENSKLSDSQSLYFYLTAIFFHRIIIYYYQYDKYWTPYVSEQHNIHMDVLKPLLNIPSYRSTSIACDLQTPIKIYYVFNSLDPRINSNTVLNIFSNLNIMFSLESY